MKKCTILKQYRKVRPKIKNKLLLPKTMLRTLIVMKNMNLASSPVSRHNIESVKLRRESNNIFKKEGTEKALYSKLNL
jgi:hypothetical protein